MKYIYYHSNDLDGKMSAAIALIALKGSIEAVILCPINYGEPFSFEHIKYDDNVYVLDFCFQPFEKMIELKSRCYKLIWIDHHVSALKNAEAWKFECDGIRRDGVGACQLTWDYFFDITPNPPVIVRLLAQYDVWDFHDNRTLPFQYGMRIKETDPLSLMKYLPNNLHIHAVVDDGNIILKYTSIENKEYVQSYSFETSIDGYTALAMNIGKGSSRLFDSVTREYDLFITFCRTPFNNWSVSLYSRRKDVDCSEVAKKYGGGGHFSAAGFSCEILPFKI